MDLRRKLFTLLPLKLRESIFLKKITPFPIDDFNREFTVKVAETKDEVLQAYQLIYQTYYQAGLCELENEDIRITKHALLPTTSLIIVKKQEEVIATLSLIIDNPLGLPMENLWSLDKLRETGKQLAETSTLVVKYGYRKRSGNILIPLLSFLFDYARNHLGVDYFVSVIHPYSVPFYTALLNAKYISKEVMKYTGANGAEATPTYIKLYGTEFTDKIKRTFIGKQKSHTAYDLLNPKNYSCFIYPDRKYYRAFDPSFKLELLCEIFEKDINSLKKLNEWDKEILQQLYSFKEFEKVFKVKTESKRASVRFNVNCAGLFTDEQTDQTHFIRIYNVSDQGLLFHLVGESEPNIDAGSIILKISKDKSVNLKVKVIRSKNNQFGAKVLSSSPQNEWFHFIDYLKKTISDKESSIEDFSDLVKNNKEVI